MNRGFPSNCGCGGRIAKFISSTQDNPGRPFFRCEARGEHPKDIIVIVLTRVITNIKSILIVQKQHLKHKT
ncbi:hypothetical protein N665_0216s0015 [Sinapis alba]|nr:hypothetical protein N665_0216s0015 [Sinapis alba]